MMQPRMRKNRRVFLYFPEKTTALTRLLQLFFMDSSLPAGDASSSESESEAEDGTRRQPKKSHYNRLGRSDDETSGSEASGSDSESEEESDDDESASSRSSVRNPFAPGAGKAKKPTALWHDPADDQIRVDLAADRRLRKLADGKTGDAAVVGGKGLESKLREQ